MIVKKIHVLPLAKIMGAIYGIIGFALGALFAVLSLLGLIETSAVLAIFGVLSSLIILPIIYGAAGFLGGAASAWLYNILAERIGALELTVELQSKKGKR